MLTLGKSLNSQKSINDFCKNVLNLKNIVNHENVM